MEHKNQERQKYNRLILEEISKMVEKYPDMRFNQLLYSMRINEILENESRNEIIVIDKFNEESSKTYQTLNREI
jgi:hypothetical protein